MSTELVFKKRLEKYYDELKWLYMELYDDMGMFEAFCKELERYALERSEALCAIDAAREADPDWYKRNDMLGMQLYVDAFAGNLQGVKSKLDYIEACGVNYLHLMPLLDTVDGRSDGGYAVADFRKVKKELGTMDDLRALIADAHERGISICLDFVMNHTSEDHEWAMRAKAGEKEYQDRYFFYDNYDIPGWYEQTVPQVFPTTAPGNFTWLEGLQKFVMTSFYPYQWDLNYRNPIVLNEMVYNMLYLVNCGIDIIRIDAVPYIWKELGTNCRNLPQVHNIVRMMRIVTEVCCPGVLLLGEVVMEPEKVVPYFGTVEKPECHMLYNVTTMASTWHTVATKDVRLLRNQLDIVNRLPKDYVFLNYLRCHDDIGWGLDYPLLRYYGMEEVPHKKFLNDYFRGRTWGSISLGECYNEDFVSGDARFCATTASMCGIERAADEKDAGAMARAIRFDLTLHAYLFMQSGIPIIYSGDEIARTNDWGYKLDPLKAEDSRYIHRGHMLWDQVDHLDDLTTPAGQVFAGLRQLEKIRAAEKAFVSNADCWTIWGGSDHVLGLGRYYDGDVVVGMFNFSEYELQLGFIDAIDDYTDLMTGEKTSLNGKTIPPYGFFLYKQNL